MSFRRITSLVKRNRQETPYRAWQEDQEQVDNDSPAPPVPAKATESVVEFPVLTPSPDPTPDPAVDKVLGATNLPVQPEQSLIECFYLGSTDMSGQEIKGRGCIDTPAALIWKQSQQEEKKPKRMNSWPTKHHQDTTYTTTTTTTSSFRPRYVKLVTGPDALQVYDNSTGEIITHFSYRKISFVGTHPKYARLFAFIAETSNPCGSSPAFCHAFKCEDKDCAKQAACSLSDLFHKKIQELLQSQKLIN